jgi:hypothetical protein
VPQLPLDWTPVRIAAGYADGALLMRQHGTSFCAGDGSAAACPCANSGDAGRGCQNSALTGGARLEGAGMPRLSADSVQLLVSGELSTALTVVLQGNAQIAPTFLGDGVRCVGGYLRRLFVRNAAGGVLSVPQPGDPSVSARSAQLLDSIAPGSPRYYQVYYRDPSPSFCPAPQGNTFNVSNALAIVWTN